MLHSLIYSLGVIISLIACNAQSQTGQLPLVGEIKMPGVHGRMDHLTYDSIRQILYIAALGNNTVEVADLHNMKLLDPIRGFDEPQGICFIQGLDRCVITNGGNGEVVFIDGATRLRKSTLKLESDADNVRYNSTNHKIYVGFGNGGIAVFDADSMRLKKVIPLPGHPESFQINQKEGKLFVNIPDEKRIEVIDVKQETVLDHWLITKAEANYPMAINEAGNQLVIGCRRPARLLAYNLQSGKLEASLEIDGDADDIFYNSSQNEYYVSCGSGAIDVITKSGLNSFQVTSKTNTRPGARTALFIPSLQRLIVAAPAYNSQEATLLIYNTKHD